MSVRALASRVLGRARRRMPNQRRSPTEAPLADRLEFRIEDGVALLGIRLAKAAPGSLRLQVVGRDGSSIASYHFDTVDAQELATVAVDLAELVRRRGLRETVNLYISWQRSSAVADSKPIRRRVGGFAETTRPPRSQRAVIDGIELSLEVTVRGNLVLRVDDDPGTGVRLTPTDIRRVHGRHELVCDVKTHNRAIVAARTVVAGRISRTRISFDAPYELDEKATSEDSGLLHFMLRPRIDLAELAAAMPPIDELVDVTIELTIEGRDEVVTVVPRLPEDFEDRHLQIATIERDGMTHLLMPYLTYRTRRFAYRMERFRTEDYRYLRRLLRIAWLFPLVKPFTRIWLVGELPYRAQDNGLAFFRYLRTEQPRRRAYYVIDATSPDRDKLLPLGNVLDRGSRRHLLYSLLASRLVSSHHAEYLFASRHPSVTRFTRGVRIFLQHGITAAKNVTPIYARQRTQELPTERFLVASELERRIVIEDYGYRPSQVPVTGFARFDTLFADHGSPEPTIVVMPTWREGLRADSFLDSDYYRNWHSLLSDSRFHRLTQLHSIRVRLVLHPNLRTLGEFFHLPGVDIVAQEDVDVQQLLLSASVLVTDFSSVAWDFAFLRRPVLYFQFDRQNLVGARAPHIDVVTQLPGPVAGTVDRLVEELAEVLARTGTMSEEHWERAQQFLTYRDRRNGERIYREVERAWRPSTVLNRVRNARGAQRRWWRFRNGPTYFTWMQRLFGLASRLPRREEIVFECDRGRHFGDAPRYLYERLVHRSQRPVIVWANNTTLRLTDPGSRKIERHSPTYYWHLGRARYWINNQNFPPDLVKPARTTFLQTWHGTPVKKMQHDVANMASRDAGYQGRAARLTSYWDVLLSGSPYATQCFRSAFRFSGRILEEGYPRNDVFSWPDASERARATRQRLDLDGDPRAIILYAPTFRDDNRPGANWGHDLALDIDRLATELAEDHVLIVRLHPLVRESLRAAIARHPQFVIDGSPYDDIQELMLVSDVLITDYSSVFFDWTVLQRPVLFFTYDLDHYRDELRGFYLDLESQAPGPMVRDNDELIAALKDIDGVRARYAERLHEFRDTYAPRDDGGASDRVLDAAFGDAISGPVVGESARSTRIATGIEHPDLG